MDKQQTSSAVSCQGFSAIRDLPSLGWCATACKIQARNAWVWISEMALAARGHCLSCPCECEIIEDIQGKFCTPGAILLDGDDINSNSLCFSVSLYTFQKSCLRIPRQHVLGHFPGLAFQIGILWLYPARLQRARIRRPHGHTSKPNARQAQCCRQSV